MAFTFNFRRSVSSGPGNYKFKKLNFSPGHKIKPLHYEKIDDVLQNSTVEFCVKEPKKHTFEEKSYFEQYDHINVYTQNMEKSLSTKFNDYYLHFQNSDDMGSFLNNFKDCDSYQEELEELCQNLCNSTPPSNSSSDTTNKYVKIFNVPIFKETLITHDLNSTDIICNVWVKTIDDRTFFNDNTTIEIINKNKVKVSFTNFTTIKSFKIIIMS